MKLFAKVYAVEPIQHGMSENGEWVRRTVVIETLENDPKLIALDAYGERRVGWLDDLTCGQFVELTFNIEAHEHEGRWYNRVNLLSLRGYAATC